jgi:DNA-binding MarR family transcriptional regulator
MADKAELSDLLIQMRITNRLLAAQVKATMKQQDLIGLLNTSGASQQEIADLLNTTQATVAATLQRLKAIKKRERK